MGWSIKYYSNNLTPSKPSDVLQKIKKLISIKKTPLTTIEIFIMKEDDIIDNTILLKILDICKTHKLNINNILYKNDKTFCIAPRIS